MGWMLSPVTSEALASVSHQEITRSACQDNRTNNNNLNNNHNNRNRCYYGCYWA